jgi:hypothetical protein
MSRLRLKPGDLVLIFALSGLILFLFTQTLGARDSERVVVTTPRGVRSYPLDQDRVVLAEGPLGVSRVVIEDGEAWIQDSPCRKKICIRMGKLRRPGQQAVCLPNRVIVELEGSRRQVDGVSR